MNLADIYQSIGRVLSSNYPKEAKHVIYEGVIYPDFTSKSLFWVNNLGKYSASFPEIDDNKMLIDKLTDLVKELKKSDEISISWNQYRFIINDKKILKIELIFIEESESFPGLIMKGLSDLSKEEADENNIPDEIWLQHVKNKVKIPSPIPYIFETQIEFNNADNKINFPKFNKIVIDEKKGAFINIKDTLQLIIPDGANAIVYEFTVFSNGISSKLKYIDQYGKKHDIPINSVINNYKTGDITEALIPLFKKSYEYSLSQGEHWNSAVFTVFKSGQAEMSTI